MKLLGGFGVDAEELKAFALCQTKLGGKTQRRQSDREKKEVLVMNCEPICKAGTLLAIFCPQRIKKNKKKSCVMLRQRVANPKTIGRGGQWASTGTQRDKECFSLAQSIT